MFLIKCILKKTKQQEWNVVRNWTQLIICISKKTTRRFFQLDRNDTAFSHTKRQAISCNYYFSPKQQLHVALILNLNCMSFIYLFIYFSFLGFVLYGWWNVMSFLFFWRKVTYWYCFTTIWKTNDMFSFSWKPFCLKRKPMPISRFCFWYTDSK